jgi:TolB-like protein
MQTFSSWQGATLGWLVAAAAVGGPVGVLAEEPPPLTSGAVFPMQVRTEHPARDELGRLMATSLAAALGKQSTMRLITMEDVAEGLAYETQVSLAGGNNTEALTELGNALGVDVVVTGDVVASADHVVWTATLLDARTSVIRARGTVRAGNVDALPTAAEDMALQLTAKGGSSKTTVLRAEQLGLESEGDLAAFRSFREARPASTTGEALTAFIMEHNTESTVLAVAEGALLLTSNLLLAAASSATIVGVIAYTNQQ